MKKKTVLITAFSLLALLLLASAATGCVIYLHSAMYGQFEVREPENPEGPSPELGELFELELGCDLPWSQEIADIDFTLPEGLMQAGTLQKTVTARTLHGRHIRITLPVKSYLTGDLPPPEAMLEIERPLYKNGTAKTTYSMPLRPVKIQPRQLASGSDLPLAGEIQPPAQPEKHHPYRAIGTAVACFLMLLAVLTAVIYYLKKHWRKNIAPWDKALAQIAALSRKAAADPDSLRVYAADLSDILRDYLNSRFHWPVNRQTAEEFIILLHKKDTGLPPEQIAFLENFIQAADLVKFANFTPEMSNFIAMLDSSEQLINATIPQNEKMVKTENKK